jgi:hypothetical protein
VQVRGPALDGDFQKIVDVHVPLVPNP